MASWCQVRPPLAVASRVPASPTAKQRDAVRQPASYRVRVVPLCSVCQVAVVVVTAAGAGAAEVQAVQLATATRASAASAVLMATCYHARAALSRGRATPSLASSAGGAFGGDGLGDLAGGALERGHDAGRGVVGHPGLRPRGGDGQRARRVRHG